MSRTLYWAAAVLVMAVVTYLPRPFAVLGAMTFPAILYATATPWSALAGFAVALLLSWFGLSLLPVALASTAMVFAVEWAMRLGGLLP